MAIEPNIYGQPTICVACGQPYTPGCEPDPCIGYIAGARNACCGHGDDQQRYVSFADHSVYRGQQADQFLGEPPVVRDPLPDLDYTCSEVIASFQIEREYEEDDWTPQELQIKDTLLSWAQFNYWLVDGDCITRLIEID